LLEFIEEFHKQVGIAGFKDLKIEDVEAFLEIIKKEKPPDTEIQVFNADLIATWQHLYFAALNALTAFKNRRNLSKSLAMETMLYASAQHQIRKATETLGIKPNQTSIAVLAIGRKPVTVKTALSNISKQIKAKPDETVLEVTDEKMANIKKAFEISDEQLKTVMKQHKQKEALVDLVIEKMALLATEH
jgi:tRNA threonylcarbamoyladenosine modification (KEOPS) complex Cgi121 subunit